jgi:hypothetical protein
MTKYETSFEYLRCSHPVFSLSLTFANNNKLTTVLQCVISDYGTGTVPHKLRKPQLVNEPA